APEIVPGDPQPLARVGQEVREKDVGPLDEPVEEGAPVVGPEIDPDAALVPADLLHDEVPTRRAGDDAARDEPADRIAVARTLHLDDLRAPVGERRARGGYESPVGDLEHLHAVQ